MDRIYIAPLSKALYNFMPHSPIYTPMAIGCHARYQPVGVLLRDTSKRPGWDRTSNPPTARRLFLPPEPYRPHFIQYYYYYICITIKYNTVYCV